MSNLVPLRCCGRFPQGDKRCLWNTLCNPLWIRVPSLRGMALHGNRCYHCRRRNQVVYFYLLTLLKVLINLDCHRRGLLSLLLWNLRERQPLEFRPLAVPCTLQTKNFCRGGRRAVSNNKDHTRTFPSMMDHLSKLRVIGKFRNNRRQGDG